MDVFFESPDGTSVMRSLGVLPPPDGWVPLTEQEYQQRMAAHQNPDAIAPVNMLGVGHNA